MPITIDDLHEKFKQLQNDMKVVTATKKQCDFKIHKDPKKWLEGGGESFEGQSILNVDGNFKYLSAMEKRPDFMASQDEEKVSNKEVTAEEDVKKLLKYAGYKRLDAARCRRLIALALAEPRKEKNADKEDNGDGIPF